MTDTCFPEGPYDLYDPFDPNDNETFLNCFYHKDAEFIIIHQNENFQEENFYYFCGKRPRFSIYAQNLVDVDYHMCKMCLAYESKIKFIYQTLDADVTKTTRDNHYRIFYGGLNWKTWTLQQLWKIEPWIMLGIITTQCLFLSKMGCYTDINEYYIWSEKYHKVIIWKAKRPGPKLYLFNSIKHNFISRELGPSKKFLNSFNCFYIIILNFNQHYQHDFKIVTYKFSTVIERNITIYKTSAKDFTVKIKPTNSLSKVNHHQVYKVNNAYTKIQITNMNFKAWKVP